MKTKKRKIFFTTTFKLCDNNGYLSTQIQNFFARNGHPLVAVPEDSDVMVISTCGFDQERENTAIAIIDGYVKQYAREKRIIICGCLTRINPGLFDLTRITLIGPKALHRFNDIFQPAIPIEEISGGQLDTRFISGEYGFPDAYYVQICQGCVNHCSYCAIKKAKGYVTSKPVHHIIEEVKKGLELGYDRFMLLGDDCGSYGADLGMDLEDLLYALGKYDIRLYINYIEPAGFLRFYSKTGKEIFEKIDFMNIPVQSTAERILGLMNRLYDVDAVIEKVAGIKRDYPDVYLESHVIYGFPGETEAEFQDSFRLAGCFDSVIYFYYTDRRNVPSSLLPGKLSCEALVRRTRYIMEHPRYAGTPGDASSPMVLLGYGLNETEMIASIEKSRARGASGEDLIIGT